jgi:CheY-like chemotaxis protein
MKKILIVDDETDVCESLSKILKRSGYEVVSASNGKEALKQVKSFRPNLLILDVMLPDMDGTDVAKALSNDMSTQNIPVIFLTGLIPKEKQDIATSHDIYITIAKPVEKDELLKVVEKALSD